MLSKRSIGPAVSLTFAFEKGSSMSTGQAALVGLLAGIVAIPVFYVVAVGIDLISAYSLTVATKVDKGGSALVGVFGVASLFRQFFNTLFFAPFALVLATLGAALSLNLFHKERITTG